MRGTFEFSVDPEQIMSVVQHVNASRLEQGELYNLIVRTCSHKTPGCVALVDFQYFPPSGSSLDQFEPFLIRLKDLARGLAKACGVKINQVKVGDFWFTL